MMKHIRECDRDDQHGVEGGVGNGISNYIV